MPRTKIETFEEIMLPHLNAAHNLARWMLGGGQDAHDVVQEAYLRALRFFDACRGDGKAWLLEIVRNTCRTWQRREGRFSAESFDEAGHHSIADTGAERDSVDHERLGVLRACIEKLPPEFREVLVLRELEELSYREIGEVTGLAPGTVMSRLSRARKRLENCAARHAMGAK